MTPPSRYEPKEESLLASQPGKLPLRVTGLLAADDAIGALKLAGKWHPWRAFVLFLIATTLGSAIIVGGRGIQRGWPLLVAAGIGAAVVSAATVHKLRRFTTSLAARPEFQQPVCWTFAEDGLFVDTATSQHFHTWNAFTAVIVSEQVVIFVRQGQEMFNFVPRRFIESERDWQVIRQLLAARLPVREKS